MRVLFCSSWPRDDGLTRSTVDPAIAALEGLEVVAKVALFAPSPSDSTRGRVSGLRRDLARFKEAVDRCRPDVVIVRGVPAGNLASWPGAVPADAALVIESFEPHARYMRDAGEWSRLGTKFLVQSLFETRQRSNADHLVCVSERFRAELIERGHPPRDVSTMPCLVDTQSFAYDEIARTQVRNGLGLDDRDVVLVHLGKFGGVYFDDEAFQAFRTFSDHAGDRAFVMVLTPHDPDEVRRRAAAVGVDGTRLWVGALPHREVARHLSAADVAVTTWRPIASSYACSPVKDAEYWASGLPVLISPGIGDDSELVSRHRLGWVGDLTDPGTLRSGIDHALEIASEPDARARLAGFARTHRSFERLGPHYDQLLQRVA